MECLRAKQAFHIARYNDGEWIFTLQIEPYYTHCINAHNHDPQEVAEISKKMLSVIDSQPPYFIGIDSSTLALTGSILPAKDAFLAKIKPLNIVYGELFNAATVMFGIDILVKPLLDRWVLTVGPDYMRKLKISEHHVPVPINNCWNQVDQIQKQVQAILTQNLDKKPVVVYSCSMVAKCLVDAFYKKFGDAITQLDIGSCIDPWCGVISRPWHNALFQTHGVRYERLKADKQPQYGYPQYGYTKKPTTLSARPQPELKPMLEPMLNPEPTKPILKPDLEPILKPNSELIGKPVPKVETRTKHKKDPNAPIILPTSISTGRPAPRSGFK